MIEALVDELMGCGDADLDERVRALELKRRRIEAEMAVTIGEIGRRRSYLDDGHRSLKAYLRGTCNWSDAESARVARLTEAAGAVPGLVEALHAGRIGTPQTNELAVAHTNPRVSERLVEFAPMLLDHAERLSFFEFRACVKRFVTLADLDGAHDDLDVSIENRRAQVIDLDGSLCLDGSGGDPLINAELDATFRHFCGLEYDADIAARRDRFGNDAELHPLPRTGTQRGYDALVAIMRHAVANIEAGRTPMAAGFVVNILTDQHTFGQMLAAAGLAPDATSLTGDTIDPFTGLTSPNDLLTDLVNSNDIGSRRCETSTGTVLHPHTVLRAALAGHLRRVVLGADHVPINNRTVMGLIQAAVGAIGGTLADQWKDFFTVPDGLAPTAALFAAERRGENAGRGSNTRASDDVISNGSRIIVPEGYGLVLMEQGAITGFAAEAGAYEWNSEAQDSQSIFAGDGIVSPLIKTSWERFKFGGRPGNQQRAYFVTLKELPNNRFGTQSEIYWDDAYMNAQVGAVTRGTYTLKIIDPILFVKAWVPATYLEPGQVFDFTDLDNDAASQLFNEVVGSLAPAFSMYTNDPSKGNRITKIQQDSIGFAQSLSAAVEQNYQWSTGRGLEIVATAIISIEYDETPANCSATCSAPTHSRALAATRTCRRRSPRVSKQRVRTPAPPAWSAWASRRGPRVSAGCSSRCRGSGPRAHRPRLHPQLPPLRPHPHRRHRRRPQPRTRWRSWRSSRRCSTPA
jgi:membrane protease subunit (stomatin/prohibitin family)